MNLTFAGSDRKWSTMGCKAVVNSIDQADGEGLYRVETSMLPM